MKFFNFLQFFWYKADLYQNQEATRLPFVSIIPALNSTTDGLKIMKEQNQLNINKWWDISYSLGDPFIR